MAKRAARKRVTRRTRLKPRRKPRAVVPNGAKLTEEQQEFVVCQLAMFRGPGLIATALKEDFGVKIARQSVEAYDPTKRAGRALAKKWQDLFAATRETFLKDTAAIGSAHKVVRIAMREEMALSAQASGDLKIANEILDSIAEEMGDKFTNKQKHEHSGKVGFERDISDAELEQRIAARLTELATGGEAAGVPGAGDAAGGAGTPSR